MQVQSLDQEDPLEKEMTTYSSVLAWEIPWTEALGRLQSMGSQKSQTRLNNKTTTATPIHNIKLTTLTIFKCKI